MNKKERAQKIQRILNKLFPHPEPALRHTSVYTLLIAVLLSARCTDLRVNQVTPELFKLASTPQAMVKLTVPEIRAIIRPCGLSPTKAKAIHALSQMLIEKYHGHVPHTLEELEELPGVGHKTASVVMTQGYGEPAFPVDTHIHRCAHRWGLSSGKSRTQTERDLKALFSKRSWGKLHLQMILYARTYCRAVGHKVEKCPICSSI